MKKIPTIFKRDPSDMSKILREPHPDCAWVFAGEGVATQKYDGTCCMVRDGTLFKRREIKRGQSAPPDFVLADYDDVTGKTVGWVPVTPEDKWHVEAFVPGLPNGTYELVGPKVQGNPEGYDKHTLLSHAHAQTFLYEPPRDFDGLSDWLSWQTIEGIVFHHPDGRMAKIKRRDFGYK